MKTYLFILASLAISFGSFSQSAWYPQNAGTNNFLFDIHFTDQNHGWLCGNTGLIMSTTDGGVNWIELDAPPVNYYYGIHFTDMLHGWAVGFGGQISHTADAGETWSEQTGISNTFLYDLFFLNADTGWIVGGDNGNYPSFIKHREIMFTNNGGLTWTAQLSQSESPLRCVHFADKNSGYAAGEGGNILRTTNGGITWINVMSDSFYEFNGVHVLSSSTAFAVGHYLGLPHVSVIFRTIDGGDTWTSQTFEQDEGFYDIYFSDNYNGWAVGGSNNLGRILRTTDGGDTWFNENSGANSFLTSVFFIDESSGWAVGANGTIISTQHDISTGLDHQVTKNDLSIYPNPASDRINILLEKDLQEQANIRIVNSMGQVVYIKELLSSPYPGQGSINVSDLPTGLYTVVVGTESERKTNTVIIR